MDDSLPIKSLVEFYGEEAFSKQSIRHPSPDYLREERKSPSQKDHAHKHSANEEELLTQISPDSSFDAYHNACASSPELMMRLVKAAKEHGGASLVTQMIQSQNYRGLREAVHRDDKVTTLLILNALEDAARRKALAFVPNHWEIFHQDRKIKKDELLQEIGGGKNRWKEIIGRNAPHRSLDRQSPYKFSPTLYQAILPEIQTACALENHPSIAETIAHKLSVLFSNTNEVDQYFRQYEKKWKDSKEPFSIISATDFTLPQQGLWNVLHWQSLLMKNGPQIFEYLEQTPEIEKVSRVLNKPIPNTLREIRATLSFSSYERASENPRFAIAASIHDIDEDDFNTALDYMKKHALSADQMPDVFIDGSDIGHPGYYFTKLMPNDPMQCLLGQINNHSVHLMNDAGQYAVPHIVQSQYAGAYVLKKKQRGKRVTDEDKIVADSWAYMSEQNVIVFDGIGSKESSTSGEGPISNIDRIFHRFLQRFAYEVIDKHCFSTSSQNIRKDAETSLPDLFRNDAHTVYVEGVRLGDNKAWEEELGEGTRQIDSQEYGQFFNPQDKLPGWIHNESQSHQLIIKPDSHEKNRKNFTDLPNQKYEARFEEEARKYIEFVTRRLHDEYGIIVRMGLELEFFAYDKEGKRRSHYIDQRKVSSALAKAGLPCRFEDENTDDYDGQYEAALPPLSPLEQAERATATRQYLKEHAADFGLSRFDFASVIDADPKNRAPIEPSSTHINFTLWSRDGRPLTTKINSGNGFSTLTNVVAKGTLDVQRKLSVLFAQSARDFQRFGYMSPAKREKDSRSFSPNLIFWVSEWGRIKDGPSLAVWGSGKSIIAPKHPQTVRLENRLAGSDVNYFVAIAGQMAAIEWALDNYTKIIPAKSNRSEYENAGFQILNCDGILIAVHNEFTCQDKKYTGWDRTDSYTHRKRSYTLPCPQDVYFLPGTRQQAIEQLAAQGNQVFGRQRLGEDFYNALILHQVPEDLLPQFNVSPHMDHTSCAEFRRAVTGKPLPDSVKSHNKERLGILDQLKNILRI